MGGCCRFPKASVSGTAEGALQEGGCKTAAGEALPPVWRRSAYIRELSRFRNRNNPPRGFLPHAVSAEFWRHHKKASILPSHGEPAKEAEPAPSRAVRRVADGFAHGLLRKSHRFQPMFSPRKPGVTIRKPAFSPLSANRQRRRNQHRAAAVRRVALTNSLVGFIEKSRFQSVHSPRKPYP